MTVKEKDEPMNDRMCIVTRESGPAETLIRFVAGPDGTVVPDLKRSLPGRGCSVKASRALVDKAVQKQLFARALKSDVKALPELGAQVDRLLASPHYGEKMARHWLDLARYADTHGFHIDSHRVAVAAEDEGVDPVPRLRLLRHRRPLDEQDVVLEDLRRHVPRGVR